MSKTNDFVRELMPHSTEKEISEAEEKFRDYILVVKEIAERLEREGEEITTDSKEQVI